MATQGPTAVPYDAGTFTNTKAWAGSVQGINAALAAFGWTQSSDSNQIDWTNATVAPFASASFPNVALASNATAAGPVSPYTINLRGNWSSANTYTYGDVARSTVGAGGTGNDYILSRGPFVITATSVTAGVATITAANNLVAGDIVRFVHMLQAAYLLQGTFTVLAAGLSASQFEINVPQYTTSYASQNEGTGTTTSTPSLAVIVLTSSTRPETDTKNWVPYFYEIWKTADSVTYAQTAQTVQYVAGSQTLAINTGTTNTRIKAGFNVTISGATTFPQINGTWCVNSAIATQLTFIIANSVSGYSSDFGPNTDTFTIQYTLAPIYMRLEYWANSVTATAPPWIRVAFGTGEDGNGNLTGNRFASDTPATTQTQTGYGVYASSLAGSSAQSAIDLRHTVASNTSTIWRCIWSGANNRFGTAMFYNRNDTNVAAANGACSFWVVERGIDNSSGSGTINYLDDYFTVLLGCAAATQLSVNLPVMQRHIPKANPNVTITQVQVDASNNCTITYSTNQGFQFQVGAIVYMESVQLATFLTGQFLRVTAVTSNTFTAVITAGHASYGPLGDSGFASQSISTTVFTPIVGTGGLYLSDSYIATVRSSGSQTVNGNTPLMPVHPVPGFVGNPMTMAMSVKNTDAGANDTTTSISLYGSSHTYYSTQGTNKATQPFLYFGNAGTADTNMYLRWD